MLQRVDRAGLSVDGALAEFVESELVVGLDIEAEAVWQALGRLVSQHGGQNRELLEVRAEMQRQIDAWHRANPGKPNSLIEYEEFLMSIGYLVAEGGEFSIDTPHVDDEIARICGPQLVVPVMNARYALNAANARWGSLYDALYGTDALGSQPPAGPYSQSRGGEVVAWSKRFLDMAVPLLGLSHGKVEQYVVVDSRLEALGESG